jgi:hypothetical protein
MLRPKVTANATIDASGKQVPKEVRISPEQPLLQIGVENLRHHDAQILKEIRNLNPWLKDPDHIRTDQEIRMPLLAISVAGAQVWSL